MKLLYGQSLVEEFRKLSEKVTKRLWIAVPYIGSPTTVRRILGKTWFESPSVSIKLLTDISDLSCINTETIRHFYDRGQVKSLTGLHAKIYIIDDACLLSSANLTNTAFSKRHEIGVLYNSSQAEQIVAVFEHWWGKSEDIKPNELNKIFSKQQNSKEEQTGNLLPTLFKLPDDPGPFIKNLGKNFLHYDRLVVDFRSFANTYSSIQRIWKNQPLFFEIDGFLDFLFHHDSTPSREYDEKSPRNFSEGEQMDEIKKWALRFKEWADSRDDNDWRLNNSRFIRKYLSPSRIQSLTKTEIYNVLLKTNAGKSRRGNCNKICNEKINELSDVRNALNIRVNEESLPLPERFNKCNIINGIGPSIMNELLGFCYPDKYPLINKNSKCGLRFFGYKIRV